jgi:ABC transport system ATP-binding/permease protein
MVLLAAHQLAKAYGPQVLFTNVEVTVSEGDRVGLLGVNGAGKSTLLKCLGGLEPTDGGTIERQRGASILFLEQEPELPADVTARAWVEGGLDAWAQAKRRHEAVSAELGAGSRDPKLVDELAHLGEELERLGGWARDHEVDEVLQKLGIRKPEQTVGTMSGGERRRVALARILVARPHLAILDEPTNHLDADVIAWLETFLVERFPGAVLMVTHDRYVLDAVCNRILELDRGALNEYTGNYGDYLEARAEADEHEARVEANRQNFLRREVAWLRRGAKARTTKQKARIQRAQDALAIEAPKERGKVVLEADASRLGGTILDVEGAVFTMGARTLNTPITLRLTRGERIGIVGPNGLGKTTLLKAVAGEGAPVAGKIQLGAQTKIAYFDQARADLPNDWTIFDAVAGQEGSEVLGGGRVTIGGETLSMRAYLERFLFEGSKLRQKVGSLSGGERARVALAKALRDGANVLLLDEPTNDLDVSTLEALETLLSGWPGCALVVSHDRAFLDAVATGILAFEGDGVEPAKVTLYQGNFETYQTLKAEAEAARAEQAKPARAPSIAPAAATATRAASAPAASAPPTKKVKLSWAEEKELDGIMDAIGAAEDKVSAIEAELANPDTFSDDGTKARALTADLERAKAEAERLTARWEELEAKKTAAKG